MVSQRTWNIIGILTWAAFAIPLTIYANTRYITAINMYLLLLVVISNMRWKE